jgi:predicted small metal-binding protein
MSRKIFDCRDWPGPCTLVMTGEEDEVVDAQVLHVVGAHGQQQSPQLRELIRGSLRLAPAGV